MQPLVGRPVGFQRIEEQGDEFAVVPRRRARLDEVAVKAGEPADTEDAPIESHLVDIAVAIVVHGERICRASAQHWREYVIERKAEIAEEQRKAELERQRKERERLERVEKARIARLLAQATALRQADDIRTYVDG